VRAVTGDERRLLEARWCMREITESDLHRIADELLAEGEEGDALVELGYLDRSGFSYLGRDRTRIEVDVVDSRARCSSERRANASRERRDNKLVRVLDQFVELVVRNRSIEHDCVPVLLVEVVAGPNRGVGRAQQL